MEWLIPYAVGYFLMLVLFGAAVGDDMHPRRAFEVAVTAMFWPLILPMLVGFLLRGDR